MKDSPPSGDSDAQLVERTLAGDDHAFELLVLKYQRRIQRLIARMVRDVNLVEDIAQESFIRAYRALHQFRGDAQFYTWLYRIAVNTAKKALLDLKHDPLVTEAALRPDGEDDETFQPGNEPIGEETPETLLAMLEAKVRFETPPLYMSRATLSAMLSIQRMVTTWKRCQASPPAG